MNQRSDWSLLVEIAARLVRGSALPGLSYFAEDMPKSTPKSVLRDIERAHEMHKVLGLKLRQIADRMIERERAMKAESEGET